MDDLFGNAAPLREPLLTLPLYVHFPGGLAAARRIGEPTELYNLTRTTLAALGLAIPPSLLGRDLTRIALGLESGGTSPQIALLGDQYSARWGNPSYLASSPARPRSAICPSTAPVPSIGARPCPSPPRPSFGRRRPRPVDTRHGRETRARFLRHRYDRSAQRVGRYRVSFAPRHSRPEARQLPL